MATSFRYPRALILATTSMVLLVVYALTAGSQPYSLEAVDFIAGPFQLGLLAAPGYPAFTLLGFLFGKILWWVGPASQIHLLNSTLGAFGAGVLALVVFRLFESMGLAILSGLIFGFTSLAWTLATSSEVFSFDLLITNLLWLSLFEYKKSGSRHWFWALTGFLGLGLTHCLPLTLLNGIGLVMAWKSPVPGPRHSLPKPARIRATGFFILGLSPVLLTFIQFKAVASLPYVAMDFSTSDGPLSYLTAMFSVFMSQPSGVFFEKWRVLGHLLGALANDFMLFSPLLALGLYQAFKTCFPWRWPLIVVPIASLLAFCLMTTISAKGLEFESFRHLFLATTAYLTIFAIYGLLWIHLHFRMPSPIVLLGGLGILGLVSQMHQGYPLVKAQNQPSALALGTALLKSLPDHANVIVCGDSATPLRYVQSIAGVRDDLQLYGMSLAEDGRMHVLGPLNRAGAVSDQLIGDLFKDGGTPTYLTGCKKIFQDRGFQLVNKGLAFQLLTGAVPEASGMTLTPEQLKGHLDSFHLAITGINRLDDSRQYPAVLLLAYAYRKKVISSADLWLIIQGYGLDQSVHFLSALAGELAYGDEPSLNLAMDYFQKVEYEDLDQADPEDVTIYCRILIASNNLKLAQIVCAFPEQAARTCNGDLKYNMGRAFWKRKAKSLAYLREAVQCNPRAQTIQETLANREKAP